MAFQVFNRRPVKEIEWSTALEMGLVPDPQRKDTVETGPLPSLSDYLIPDIEFTLPSEEAGLERKDRLLKTGVQSDYTIVCGDREWKVHKAIIQACDYFKMSLKLGYKDTIENTSTFDPEDILPCEVDWLVKFPYSRPVDPTKVCKELGYENSILECCCRLWHLGEYFGLPRLQEKALSLLQNRVNVIIDTMENGQVPDPIGEEIWAAVDTCWTDINFAIREYGGCKPDLLRLCHTAAEALFSDKGFYQLLDENPEFAVDLAGHMCKQAQPKGHSARRMWIKYRRCQSSKIRGRTDWSEEVIKLNRQAAKRFGSTITAVTDVLGQIKLGKTCGPDGKWPMAMEF